ncbi:hypothetical protein [Virgibacillus halodenitrificans]|uniref:hypothetical protein n=1 Tax=Virgibacillus halodenitrificans TaxID=1482 RepID=UPI001F196B7B|nr:hypothetical protein [Virgibacillus halodenitrificans]
MDAFKINGYHSAKIISNQPKLQSGQILKGHILKIFPDNKALIQLGNKRMNAQLEASLTIGGRYHFLVTSTDHMVRLKVLGKISKSKGKENIDELINHLGLKVTKYSTSLVDELINKKIPFDKHQLVKALQLLGASKNKTDAIRILVQMIEGKIPLTTSTYAAFETRFGSISLNEELKALYNQLQNNGDHRVLHDQLHDLLQRPRGIENIVSRQLYNEMKVAGYDMDRFLRFTGMSGVRIRSTEQENLMAQVNKTNPNSALSSEMGAALSNLRPELMGNLPSQLTKMVENKMVLMEEAKKMISFWKTLSPSIEQLPTQLFAQLRQQINDKISPLLTVEQKQYITTYLKNNTVSLDRVFAFIESLSDENLYSIATRLLGRINKDHNFSLSSPKEQFLLHLNHQLNHIGLNDEHNISKGLTNEITVKQLLIQILSNSDGSISEQSQKLLHYINGIQLNSVMDTSSGIAANLLLPGEKIGLKNDLELDFKGKRKDNGEIDPDYCHIVFYLELANIKNTIIDMNIQKRNINLTIFNQSGHLKYLPESLKAVLKNKLTELDYNLTHIQLKDGNMKELEKAEHSVTTNSYKGVDYRV